MIRKTSSTSTPTSAPRRSRCRNRLDPRTEATQGDPGKPKFMGIARRLLTGRFAWCGAQNSCLGEQKSDSTFAPLHHSQPELVGYEMTTVQTRRSI